MSKLYILKSYRIGLVNLGLLMIAIISIVLFKNNSDASAFLVGLPLLIAGILAIIGTVQVVKGRKEGRNFKFFFALVINLTSAALLLFLIVANLLDVAEYLN